MEPSVQKKYNQWQWRTIIVLMIGYALFYFVRKNFSLSIPGLEAEYGINKKSFGILMTLVTVIYGVSRYINGIIADRFSARYHMALGLLLCGIASIGFGFGADISTLITGQTSGSAFINTMLIIFGILLVVNNIFQGCGFPPCARLLSHWIPQEELATKMSIWNTSHSIGACLIAVLCGWILGTFGANLTADPAVVSTIAEHLNVAPDNADKMKGVLESAAHVGAWKWCFWIPGILAIAGAVGVFLTLRDTPSSVGLPEIHNINKKGKENEAEFKAFVREMVYKNKWVWILAIANFFVYIVRMAVLDWGPTFLKEARGMSLSNSVWTIAVFELFGIMGTLIAGKVTDKWLKGKAHRTCLYCMIGVAVFIGIFLVLPKDTPKWVMMLVLAMAGFFIYGPQALVGVAVASQATNRATATANGLVGIFGYASGIVSGFGIGALMDYLKEIGVSKEDAWGYVFVGMIGIAMIGMLIFALMWKVKADGYEKAKEVEAKIAKELEAKA